MSLRDILIYPDERLREIARPVDSFEPALSELVDDMFETMYQERGIGLAATQIDEHRRLFVADVSEDRSGALAFVNPEILASEGTVESEEGCLSIPGINETIARAERIRVRAQDAKGKTFEQDLEGLLAICFQHELDHLEGRLFIDYLSPLKQQRIRKKMQKAARRERV
ncbi:MULTISPECIES: peptide deformylase [unclassified Guyparkeria]|uniref:peptide deformylase n=1 Tax=unclassified Guyparkeria TaxID=2626246 RepID=UPI0007335E33|nr:MULTISPECIES: peptide deformylase [unclassified Guyparkeria]KTG16921.1 peptide deformylase [Guyparkeria sp. XI15]OAE85955.1 peptide deformylase [Guyparkeria sp. WRN-7]